jgi:hypothetical protein
MKRFLPLALLVIGCGPAPEAAAPAAGAAPASVVSPASLARALGAAPVIHLPFSESSGDTAMDRSSNGNHGTIRGAQRVRDELGRSLRFDGRNDHVRVPESRELNITGPLTISVWIKTTDPIDGYAPTQREILFRGEANLVFGFERDAVNDITWLRCYLRHSLDPLEYREVALNDDARRVRDGRWHHLAVVFRPRRDMTLYLDGQREERRETSMPSVMLSEWSNYYSIGARLRGDGTVDRALKGSIDELRLFPAALGEDDIESLYEMHVRDEDE